MLEVSEPNQVAHIELVGRPVTAMGDPDRIRQIVRNLISNALRYGGDNISIKLSNHDTTASVFVFDNGLGIPEQDQERIFQAYQRAHNAPGLAGSLGLGLAISRQIARLMGGDLTYCYQNGRSTFELTLPVQRR